MATPDYCRDVNGLCHAWVLLLLGLVLCCAAVPTVEAGRLPHGDGLCRTLFGCASVQTCGAYRSTTDCHALHQETCRDCCGRQQTTAKRLLVCCLQVRLTVCRTHGGCSGRGCACEGARRTAFPRCALVTLACRTAGDDRLLQSLWLLDEL